MSNWTRTLAVCCALALATPAAMVVAQDAKPGAAPAKEEKKDSAGLDAARSAFTTLQETQKASNEARAAANKAYREAKTDEAKAAALKELQTISTAENAKVEKARNDFVKAFGGTDLDSWDVEKDASLLETGILVLADEKSEKDIKAAIDLYEKFLVKLPKSRSATFVKTYYLPNALMGSGDLDAAATRIEKLVKEVDEQAQPGLNIFLGDIKAIKGDAEGAQKIYGEALKSIPEKLEKNDARASAKRYLEVKVALVGKPAPEINSETWLGAKARPLSALKGTVVLVDVWATW